MSGERRRILVVEDEPLVADALERTLLDLGYDVIATAGSGSEAIRLAGERLPELAIMDIRLDGQMDGIEAARVLRERHDVPVIYLTALADPKTIARASTTVPFGYLMKPFNEPELQATVEIALYRHDLELELERGRQAAEDVRLLIERVRDYAIFRIDAKARISSWNAGAERLYGYSADDIVGRPFSILFDPHKADAGDPERLLTGVERDSWAEHEGWWLREDGSCYWARLALTALPGSREMGAAVLGGYAAVVQDLTERLALEQTAIDSEQRFRTAVIHAPVPMMLCAEDGQVLAVSDAAVASAERPREHLRTLEDWFGLVEGEEKDQARSFMQRAFRGEPQAPIEMTTRMMDGEARTWLCSVSQLLQLERNRRGLVAVAVDITQQRLAEKALLEAHRQKDKFLAMLGHELRNPLAAVSHATELLKRKSHGHDEYLRPLAVLERQTQHMVKLLDGLLDVSRIVSGRMVVEQEPVDVRQVLRELVEDQGDEIARRGLLLDRDLQGPPLWVSGDRVRLAQVFGNLLSNAIRFTESPGTITIGVGTSGDDAVAIFRDSGIGMDAVLLPYIFEPFRQADQGLSRTSGGLGLGLAVVKGLVELHGGTVSVTSRPGQGTEFVIRLPQIRAPARKPPPSVHRAWPARILVIEDNRDTAEILCAVLEEAGNQVALAADGQAGLALAQSFGPELILCDIGLPGSLSGYDVARVLRARGDRGLLVAVTGYSRPEDVREALDAGFDAHLGKPIALSELECLMSEHRARRAVHADLPPSPPG